MAEYTIRYIEELGSTGDFERHMFEIAETGERIITRVSRNAVLALKETDSRSIAAQAVVDHLNQKLTKDHYVDKEILITTYDDLLRSVKFFSSFRVSI
jgi:hypothetical protein